MPWQQALVLTSPRMFATVVLLSTEAEVSKTLKQLWTLFCPRYWLLCCAFYSSLYLPSVNSTLYSRDGVTWVLNCSRFLPDITLCTTTEKVQFLFNQKIHKSFSANSGGCTHKNNADATFHSFVWCDNVSCSRKKSNREFGQCFVWSLNLFSTP